MADSKAQKQAKARTLYEKDKLSQGKIAVRIGVSERTIANWADQGLPDPENGPWKKGRIAGKLQETKLQALTAEAERHGIDEGRVFSKIAELIDAKSVAVITTQGAVSLCPMLPGAEVTPEGKADFMGIQYDVVPDRKTQGEMTKLAADVLGMKRSHLDITTNGRSLLDEVLDEA